MPEGGPGAELSLDLEQELSVLQMVEQSHRQEITHHRELQFRAFSWTNSLFLAVFGGIVASRSAQIELGTAGAAILTAMVASITVTTLILIAKSKRDLEANARVIVGADRRMGLFSPGRFGGGDSVYPGKWLNWGSQRQASIETWFYLANTILLGAAVITGSWVLL